MQKLSVLLIEDNPGDAQRIQEILNQGGTAVEVTWLQTLEAAREKLSQGEFAAILLDADLPDGQGVLVFNAVHQAAPRTPIIILTGQEDDAAALNLVQAGALDYLVKDRLDAYLLQHAMLLSIERKRSELALRASEEKFASVFRSSPNGILLTRLSDGRIFEANDGWLNMTGYAREEVLGKSTPELNLWANEDERAVVVQELRQNQKVRAQEFMCRTKSGRVIPTRLSADIILVDQQPCILSIIVDLSEHKQAETELHEVVQRYKALLAAIPEIVMEVDNNKVYTWANPAGYEFFGEDVLGKEAAAYFEGQQDTYDTVRPLFNGDESTIYLESWQRRKDGQKRLLAWWCRMLKDEQGNVSGALSSARDITESRQLAEALRESEDKFKYIFDHSVVGKSITFPNGELQVNQAFCDMIGYTQDELKGSKWQEITHPDDMKMSQQFVDLVLSGAQESVRFTKRYIHKDGSVVWVDLSTRLRRDQQGNALYFIASMNDITERVQAEEEVRQLNEELEQRVRQRTAQLEAANQELEAFSYSVSHDLRAPLRFIDGMSLALVEDYAEQLDPEAKHYLISVRAEVKRMAQLIDDLLKLSRISRTEMRTGPVDLSALAQTTASHLSEENPGRQVRLTIQPGLTARGDEALLGIVINNLLDNALKYTSKHPEAHIEFGQAQSEDGPAYFVRDDGVGFDMKYSQKLFGVFQRLHSTSEFPGTGIGLAIVQRIVHRHGGRIWAESQVGAGTTFYFTLRNSE